MPELLQRKEVIKAGAILPIRPELPLLSTQIKLQKGKFLVDGVLGKYDKAAHNAGKLQVRKYGWQLVDPESTELEEESSEQISPEAKAWAILRPTRTPEEIAFLRASYSQKKKALHEELMAINEAWIVRLHELQKERGKKLKAKEKKKAKVEFYKVWRKRRDEAERKGMRDMSQSWRRREDVRF
jgi:hypothetical protein